MFYSNKDKTFGEASSNYRFRTTIFSTIGTLINVQFRQAANSKSFKTFVYNMDPNIILERLRLLKLSNWQANFEPMAIDSLFLSHCHIPVSLSAIGMSKEKVKPKH